MPDIVEDMGSPLNCGLDDGDTDGLEDAHSDSLVVKPDFARDDSTS